MKEDHMKNGQLKPGYNLQLSTNNQFIAHLTIHPNPTGTLTLIPHLESFEAAYEQLPDQICADSGYGSEQNDEYLQTKGIEAFVKYNYFHWQQKCLFAKKNPFHPSQLHYHAEEDYYVCPMGQRMEKAYQSTRSSANQYQQTFHVSKAPTCQGCPTRNQCHQGKGNRQIQINHRLNQYREAAKELLNSPRGIDQRKKKPQEVEATFGIMKQNHGMRRLLLLRS